MKKTVYWIEGDGIGKEIWQAARPVIDAALAREVVTCGAPLHGSGALEHVLVATPRGRTALADQP